MSTLLYHHLIIKNVTYSISHNKNYVIPLLRDFSRSRTSEVIRSHIRSTFYLKIHIFIFLFKSIFFSKLFMKAIIMKIHIFHKLQYDVKGHTRSHIALYMNAYIMKKLFLLLLWSLTSKIVDAHFTSNIYLSTYFYTNFYECLHLIKLKITLKETKTIFISWIGCRIYSRLKDFLI